MKTTTVSEILRGLLLLLVIDWTAVISIPLLNLGFAFVNASSIYTGLDEPFMQMAYTVLDLCLGVGFVLLVDYFGVHVALSRPKARLW